MLFFAEQSFAFSLNSKDANLSMAFYQPPCLAGSVAPVLIDSPNFAAQTSIYTVPCGETNADLSTLSSSNQPTGTVLMIHSAATPTEANKVVPHNSIAVGTYFISFYDPTENCYSGATQQVTVVSEQNCSIGCQTAMPVDNTSSNPSANGQTPCPANYTKSNRILYFPWNGNLANGQTATVNQGGVNYTATVSNYTGSSDTMSAADIDHPSYWVGSKMKHMYSDGGTNKEGWYMNGAAYNSNHSWLVTVTATHIATGINFPVNILAFDIESTGNNESVTIQSIDGEKWTLFDSYSGNCSNLTGNGLHNQGTGNLSGVGTTRITYNDTEHNGGNSLWLSRNASMVHLTSQSNGGRQGVGMALLLDPDTDGDGLPDIYESAISGSVTDDSGTALQNVTVKLYDKNNVELQSTTTDSNGNYQFTNIQADTFRVEETDPTGYESVTPNTLNDVRTHLGSITCEVDFVNRVTLTPIELAKFQANVSNNDVLLSWETASETNNEKFVVEYSINGVEFTPFAEVKGSGFATSIQKYSTTHQNIQTLGVSKIYYRLKQIDFSGKKNYVGKILEIELPIQKNGILAYPIPANAGETIQIIGNDVKGRYFILNTLGQLVLSNQATENQFEIQTSNLAKGTYALQLPNQKIVWLIIE